MQRVVFLVLVVAVVAAMAQSQVKVSMSVVPNTPRLIVRFNATNPYDADMPLSMLTWGTPFEGVFGPIFRVTDKNGEEIPYVGKIARRSFPPSSASYLAIPSQGFQSVEVDLTEEFQFPGAGEYRIEFVPPHFDDGITFVTGDYVIGRLPIVNRRTFADRLGNTNCNPNQNSQVSAAVVGARSESLTAYNCLSRRTCSALSTRWFGTYNAVSSLPQSIF